MRPCRAGEDGAGGEEDEGTETKDKGDEAAGTSVLSKVLQNQLNAENTGIYTASKQQSTATRKGITEVLSTNFKNSVGSVNNS